MGVYRPLTETPDCLPNYNTSVCKIYRLGWNNAQDEAYLQGLFDPSLTPDLALPTLSEAQTLLPAILGVLVVAFGARLIIQLVKKG